ncbi:MAG TPA: prefoldin subunit alpha [Thermofilum sp.]|nr:prefoldin subunit alpha [Thermofilum sp.]
MSERDTREKLTAEYAIMSQLADEIKRQIDLLSTAINEIGVTKVALKELEKLSGGEEMLVPIGSSVMVRASFKKLGKVLVRVGDNVIIEKSLEKALEYLEEQEKTLRQTLERRNAEYQNVLGRLTELEKALRGSR